MFDLSGKRVWVAGARGMVGSAIVRALQGRDCVLVPAEHPRLDLRSRAMVDAWLDAQRPDAIFIAAARVGGIAANIARPAEFIYDNVTIASNIIDSAKEHGVGKLLFLGSACVYPRLAEQPVRESALLTGALEPTNEAYAVAKIAGITMCSAYRRQYSCDFISVVPTNLFGPGDNLDLTANHVVPAMISKIHEATKAGGPVEIWGTGRPRREFLFVDDAADALIFLMEYYSRDEIINVGGGEDMSIRELADAVARCIGYQGEFAFDTSRPDGMPLKALDAAKLFALGWRPRTPFFAGMERTCAWYRNFIAYGPGAHSRFALAATSSDSENGRDHA